MRYGSVCSGIEAATVAWHPLGWVPAFFSEIEPFPRAVLAHHYPHVPLHGDFTTIKGNEYGPIDLLCGGTPCQSFSIAGLRGGMSDDRGNLTLEFVRLAERTGARWLVWENVPGVLSSNKGRDFGAFLGGLAELGYGFAYRVLDAQYFGVPQRRRRVVLVGYLGDWRPAAAVLFERESLCRDITPRREKGKGIASGFEVGPSGGCVTDLAPTLDTRCKDGPIRNQLGIGIFTKQAIGEYADGLNISSTVSARDYKDSTDLICVHGTQDPCVDSNRAFALGRNSGQENAVICMNAEQPQCWRVYDTEGISPTLQSGEGRGNAILGGLTVRRLTPVECERLQGFPDEYTNIPYRGKNGAPDGPRYKAIGNSWAVPKFKWLGERIQMVEDLINAR